MSPYYARTDIQPLPPSFQRPHFDSETRDGTQTSTESLLNAVHRITPYTTSYSMLFGEYTRQDDSSDHIRKESP